jgi:two-component system OmpR family response regulator
MVANKILVVEDDQTLLKVLEYNLVKEGYAVVAAADGVTGLETAREQKPALIILDIMLPKMSGLEVCRILRKEMTVPILMLTARDDEVDKIAGLDMGADDYITKPFGMRELLARVRAALRRTEIQSKPLQTGILSFGDIKLDTARHIVTKGSETLNLTLKEFDLMAFLTTNKGLVFSRDQLLEKVWGYEYAGDTRTVDVHVRWLREKIEDNPDEPKHLITVRGVGYKLEA